MKPRVGFARGIAALALVAVIAQPSVARAEDHGHARGTPFHLAGHLLAPVGNLFGFLIVEPMFWVFDNVPKVFELE